MTQENHKYKDVAEANIYEVNAYRALDRFEQYVDGTPNDILLVASSSNLQPESKQAIRASAEKLGFGSSRISWISILGNDANDETAPLSSDDFYLLVESLDPSAVIVTDIGAMSLLSEAYGTALAADSATRVACRTCAAFSDFNSMLDNSDSKQVAWRILKNLPFEP